MKRSRAQRWRIMASVWYRRRRWFPLIEVGTFALAVGIAAASYTVLIGGDGAGRELLTPPLIAFLLVANLVPAIALLVLIGRRVAKGRAARSPIGGGGRLHVRLVAIFSLIASLPMLLVVIFASLLFQYGVEFWFSDKARGMLENASSLAQGYYQEKQQEVAGETVTMAGDLRNYLTEAPSDSSAFAEGYGWQVLSRNLSESAIVEIGENGQARTVAMVNPDARPVEKRVSPAVLARLARGEAVVVTDSADRIEAVTRLYPEGRTYLYASRIADRQALTQTDRAKTVLADYNALLERSRSLQLRFNAALFFVSLLIVGAAVWIALTVADRLVRPVGALVDAARRVAGGDLSARVEGTRTNDEVGTLAGAFNRMTRRLQQQTGDLVAANNQLDRRRALIEAVLTGVTAGVVSVGPDRRVRLMNASAQGLIAAGAAAPADQLLAELAPELDALLDRGQREAIVQVSVAGEARTLAVKVASDPGGHVLTFDDITQQLNDQRRAAWADVARRIAHEIKNPLTPIQLAAERLRRRYAGQITTDSETFVQLTDTIVRQVGDLRRIVDEFSSFARMPKPVFRPESIIDIARHAVFLHEVAHPAVAFRIEAETPLPDLVCDRRQLGQALTNLLKNAVEAIAAQPGGEERGGEVVLGLDAGDGKLVITIADSGVGLPVERERMLEPYMTTRARGTGLGLAIVNKIVEEHFGTIAFADRVGGGTVVTLCLDAVLLAHLAVGGADDEQAAEPVPAALTRARTG